MSQTYFIGVDVGTASVRACLVDSEGKLLNSCTKSITIWNPRQDIYQQSSDDIWAAVIFTVQSCVSKCGVQAELIKGIGFDATCSMVVLDGEFKPLSVSTCGDEKQNIIMWMDYRAMQEVEEINKTGHKVLQSVGGSMSVEMQCPKLMWLKKNIPDSWHRARHFFDLPDYLTWRATGSLSRGMCSVVCKWSYLANSSTDMGWDPSFFKLIGLGDLAENGCAKIGRDIQAPGSACGQGLSPQAASELGLGPQTPVGTSLIDAHAGVLGCLGCTPKDMKGLPSLSNRLVLIAGTSTCHIVCSEQRIPVPGVWGPFLSAVVPGLWVNEGGQSSAGSLLDHITSTHPAYLDVKKRSDERGVHVFEYLNQLITELAAKQNTTPAYLTHDLHVWPDFHGNRSPVADPNLKGMVSGLKLSADVNDLALIYLATVQALAYGTRHIVSEMEGQGHRISVVYVCGGLRNNRLYTQTHTDVLGLPMIFPDTRESVLLGAAMLGAKASGQFGSLTDVMTKMGGSGVSLEPDNSVKRYHEKKYQVFLQMLEDQTKYRKLMAEK